MGFGRDRYAAPRSVLREGSSLGDRGVRTSAVALGVVADFIATLAGLIGLAISLSVGANGAPESSFAAGLAALLETQSVGLSLVGINAGASAIGGFAAGSAAGRAQVRHAFLTGCVVLALGLFLAFESPDELAHWDSLCSLVLTIPAALLGGWLSRGRRR